MSRDLLQQHNDEIKSWKEGIVGTVKDFTSHWATTYYLYNKKPILNNFRAANPLAILRSVYSKKKKHDIFKDNKGQSTIDLHYGEGHEFTISWY